MHRLAALAVLLVPAAASAEPPSPGDFYVSVAGCACGAGLRGGPGYGFVGYDLALGVRYDDWWFRGALTKFYFSQGDDGQIVEPRIGIERRTYDNPHASAFFGIDTGFVTGSGLHEDATGPSTIRGGFVMPRAGIEGGGEHLRIRLSLEIVLGYGHAVDVQDEGTPVVDTRGFMDGGNLELGFTVR